MNVSTSTLSPMAAMTPDGTGPAGNMSQLPRRPPGGPPPGYFEFLDAKERVALFWSIFSPIIITIGTVGNILSIVILLRAKNRKFPTAMYLLALAISDLFILWTGPLRLFIMGVATVQENLDVRDLSVAGCKVHLFLVYVSIMFSSWLLVAVTMERIVCIYYPHKVKQLSTRVIALCVIGTLFGVIVILNGHFLFDYGPAYVAEERRVLQCVPIGAEYRDFVQYAWPWVDFSVTFLIPFLFIAIGNIAIIIKLSRSRKIGRKLSIGQEHKLKMKEEGFRSVMIMLVMLGVIFFFCMTPVSIYFIGLVYWTKKVESLSDVVVLLDANNAVLAVGFLNATLNFYLYCLSGSRFRKDVAELFCCKFKPNQDSIFEERRTSTSSGPGTIRKLETQSIDSRETVSSSM